MLSASTTSNLTANVARRLPLAVALPAALDCRRAPRALPARVASCKYNDSARRKAN